MAGLEVLIRDAWDVIGKSSMVIENKRGTPIENPMLRVIDGLQRQQLAMVRSISLGVTASKPADLNAGGKMVGDMKSEDETKNRGAADLTWLSLARQERWEVSSWVAQAPGLITEKIFVPRKADLTVFPRML
jgi:hypothetical protein